jgi:putative membrane protein
MPLEPYTAMEMSSPSGATILVVLILVSFIYMRGLRGVHKARVNAILTWRAASFVLGVSLIWAALGSPLAAYDHDLLTVHMIQHLLLMTLAPALILLGEPVLVFWLGLPRFGQDLVGLLFQLPFVQRLARTVTRPALCWTVSASTLLAWHVPATFLLGMHSAVWHSVEQASFLVAGFLFWWPVVQAWPSNATGPQWSTILYLFLATLPCDLLSGFLVFSDRVAYPVYLSMPRHFGFSALEDQQCAAALMWTCVTLVYLLPAAILSTWLLSPRRFYRGELAQLELRRNSAADRDPQSLEAV